MPPEFSRDLILEAAQRRAAAKKKADKAQAAKDNLLDFIEYVKPKYRAGWFHKQVCGIFQQFLHDVRAGKRPRVILTAPPQHGKPLYIGTMVLMGDGSRKALGDIRVGDTVITHKGNPRKVQEVFEQGELPCVRIKTEYGREVISALDHPFLTPGGWVNAGCLEPGMVLGCVPQPTTNAKNSASEAVRRQAEFRIAGYFIGDGQCGLTQKGSIHCNLSAHDPEIAEDIQKTAKLLNWDWHWQTPGKRIDFTNSYGRGKAAKGLGPRDWLRERNIIGNSHQKRVPAWVFRGTSHEIAHFLAGYFNTDGTINRRGGSRKDACTEYYSVSRDLLADVQHLLLRIGVQARLAHKKGTYQGRDHSSWRLTITSRDYISRFAEAIPATGERARRLKAWALFRQRFEGSLLEDPVLTVEPAGNHPCRCLTVAVDHTFTASDLVVHNTEIASRNFPVWAMGKYPDLRFICASYAATLADKLSLDRQRILKQPEYQDLFSDLKLVKQRAEEVENSAGGFMLAAGVDCGITGRSSDIGIIDDPVKGYKEATSDTTKEAIWNWYRTDFYTRLQSGAGVITMMTRWAENDLVGRLLEEAKNGGEQWQVYNFPALAEQDEEHRKQGEPLSTERFDEADLASMKRVQGSYAWGALYQGHPAPAEGLMLKRDFWKYYDPANLPRFELLVVSLDAAFKSTEDSDHVALHVWAFVGSRGYLIDRVCERMGYTATKAETGRLCLKYKAHVLLVEDKANGPAVIEELHRTIGNRVSVIAINAAGGKLARAWPFSADLEAGNALLPENTPWAGEVIDYCAKFPTSPMDHDVDAMTQAFAWRRENMHGLFAYYENETIALLERKSNPMAPLEKIQIAPQTPACPECGSVAVRETQSGPDGERHWRCNQCGISWNHGPAATLPASDGGRRGARYLM